MEEKKVFDGSAQEKTKQESEWSRDEQETVEIAFESRSRNEQFARVVTAVFAARLDPTVEELDDIKTAVSEAVTNAIIHGYENQEGIVHMKLTIRDRVLVIEVRDDGVGIADVKRAMEPLYTSKPSRERSGMGFSFMEAFMDKVEVESAPGAGTTVTMEKELGRRRLWAELRGGQKAK